MAYKLIPKDDYDATYQLENREIKCYSPRKLRDLYPDGSYTLVGETLPNNKEKKLEELTLPWTTLTISDCGKNSGLFHKKAGYLCVGEGKYVVLLKSRLPLLIPLFVILCAVIVAGILLLAPKGDDGGEASGGTTVLAPNVDALSPDERAQQAAEQLFTLSGVVKRGGAPYANAKVSLRQGAQVRDTKSGAEGSFTFEKVSPGEYNAWSVTPGSCEIANVSTWNPQELVYETETVYTKTADPIIAVTVTNYSDAPVLAALSASGSIALPEDENYPLSRVLASAAEGFSFDDPDARGEGVPFAFSEYPLSWNVANTPKLIEGSNTVGYVTVTISPADDAPADDEADE